MGLLTKSHRWQTAALQGSEINPFHSFKSHCYKDLTIHNYNYCDMGSKFVLGPVLRKEGYHHMTSQRAGVKTGDYVKIHDSANFTEYQIIDVEYFYEPRDTWMAMLREIQH